MSGPLGARVGSYDVEQAVVATLTEWLPDYLAEICRRRSIDLAKVPRPKAIIITKDFEGWPEDRLPLIQVVSPGMSQEPERSPEGYVAWWQVNVFTVVHARDRDATRRLRGVYEDAIPWCLLQHASLGGLCTGLQWLGEGSGDVPIDQRDDRTLQGSVTVMAAQVDHVLDPAAGTVADPHAGSSATTLAGLPAYPDDPAAEIVDFTLDPNPVP